MESFGQIKWSTYKRRGFRKGIIEKLAFTWTMKLVEVRFEQMELKERVSGSEKKSKKKERQ